MGIREYEAAVAVGELGAADDVDGGVAEKIVAARLGWLPAGAAMALCRPGLLAKDASYQPESG